MQKPVSIIIPAFNQLEYCRQCISSLMLHTHRPNCKLILVDNASTDGVAEYFDSIPGAVVVHAEENKGFAGGVNLGLEHAEGHALILNSDTIVPPGWLTRLENTMLHSDTIGMVGPMSNYVSGKQLIDGLDLSSMEAITAFAEDLARRKAGKLSITTRLVGFCILIRDTALAAVGGFDESYGIGNFEDDDYCQRLMQAGYRLGRAEDAFVFHYGNRTFQGMGIVGETWDTLLDQNRQRFDSRWRSTPETRPDILSAAQQQNILANQALEKGDVKSALALFSAAIQAAPDDVRNYTDLGTVLLRLSRHDSAYKSFQQALQCDPFDALARSSLLQAADHLECVDEAMEFLEGLKNNPSKG